MNTTAKTKRLLTGFSSFRFSGDRVGARQKIVLEVAKDLQVQQIAHSVLGVAEQAYAFRQMDTVENAANFLVGAPLPRQYEDIGRYYQALCVCRNEGVIASRKFFERVVNQSPLRYRARAMVSLGTTFVQTGDLQTARELYNDALGALRNNWAESQTIVLSHRMIAVAKSIDGDHCGALDDLERLLPLARMVGTTSPQILYDYLNGCAVELVEAGRIEEASNISRIVLASPYITAYPEWRETGSEIAQKTYSSRSVISFGQNQPVTNNVLQLPHVEHGDSFRQVPREPARILNYTEWKKKMVKEPNDKDKPELKNMSGQELLLKIIQLSSQDETTDEQLQRILEAVLKIKSKP